MILGLMALSLAPEASGPAALAQKEKKKKDQPPAPQPMVQTAQQPTRGPESDIIDYTLSEMLGAWQIGDTALLKNYFADNVIVVSGVYEPALVGWANYEPAYKRQRERMTEVSLERRNTYIVVRGNTAWATFTWQFNALVDGQRMAYRGQWSLVMERPADRWLITMTHTSVTDQNTASAAKAQPPAQNPPPQNKPPQH
jgi:ketosteroid isomerase-like protein